MATAQVHVTTRSFISSLLESVDQISQQVSAANALNARPTVTNRVGDAQHQDSHAVQSTAQHATSNPTQPLAESPRTNHRVDTLDTQASVLSLLQSTSKLKDIFLTFHVLFPNELLPALDLLDRRSVTRFVLSDASARPSVPVASTTTGDSSTNTESSRPYKAESKLTGVYFVRSSQAGWARRRGDPHSTRGNDTRTGSDSSSAIQYQVRPRSWSCTCPAFTFSAFPATVYSRTVETADEIFLDEQDGHDEHDYAHDQTRPNIHGQSVNAHLNDYAIRRKYIDISKFDVFDECNGRPGVGGLALGQKVPMCKHLLACALAEQKLFEPFVEIKVVGADELAGWAVGWGG